MKLLLDEMYPSSLAEALKAAGVEACTVASLGLRGGADADVFAAALQRGEALLTENVGDFTRISAEHLTSGLHHPGILIALSSRFSRRPAGAIQIVEAVKAIVDEQLEDRVVYLKNVEP